MEQIISILQAVISGEKEKVVEIINTDPSVVNSFSEDGWTPLQAAIANKQSELVAFLIEKWIRCECCAKWWLDRTS